jgi:hypothetical protein
MTSFAARVWAWPLRLAGLSVCGLVSALIGERGVWRVFSWIALATPLVIISLKLLRRRRHR